MQKIISIEQTVRTNFTNALPNRMRKTPSQSVLLQNFRRLNVLLPRLLRLQKFVTTLFMLLQLFVYNISQQIFLKIYKQVALAPQRMNIF